MKLSILATVAFLVVATGVVVVAQDAPKPGAPAPAAAPKKVVPDRVIRQGKPAVRGAIVSATCIEVVIRREGGGEEKYPAAEVQTIERGDAPETFRGGVSALAVGEYADAVRLLNQAAADTSAVRPWLKEAVGFQLGRAYAGVGRYDDAAAAFDSAVAAKSDTFYLVGARIGQGEALIAAGKYADADKVLAAFIQEAETKRIPRAAVLTAKEQVAKSLEAQGRIGEATGAYDAVIREAQGLVKDDPVAALRSRTALRSKVSTLIREKKLDEAGRALDSLAAEKSDDAAAMALSGRAEVMAAEGRFDAARFLLAQIIGARFAADAELPRAMLLMAKVLKELEKSGDKTAAKAAQHYLNDLIQQHAASEFAKEARTLLGKTAR